MCMYPSKLTQKFCTSAFTEIQTENREIIGSYPPFCTWQLLSRPFPIGYHCVSNCIKIHSYEHFFQDHLGSFKTILYLVYLQHNGRTAHFPATHIPLALQGPADGLRGVAGSCHPRAGSVQYPRERWYASIVGFLGPEGFKRWTHLNISKDVEKRKIPEDVFQAFTNTLEVLTSQWNYIDEMYSNI